MNRVEIIGNITRDIELKETSNGVKYIKFGIAVRKNYKNANNEYESDFFNVSAWRNTAEFISNYFSKGNRIAIAGKLQTSKYTDKDGNERTSVEILAEEVNIIDKKNETTAPAEEIKIEKAEEDVFTQFGNSIEISDDEIAF